MTDDRGHRPVPRRPVMFSPDAMDEQPGARDPAQVNEVAHETAAVIVGTGRAAHDPEVTRRLIALVEELGLSTVAELWADRSPRSLPGALWRLYCLREWVRRDPAGAAADYAAGVRFADVPHVVAGVAEPPGPDELKALTDTILHGVFEGDLAIALERAAAFCRVISAGRASRADDSDALDPSGASAQTRRAAAMLGTAEDLEVCARLWRVDDLI